MMWMVMQNAAAAEVAEAEELQSVISAIELVGRNTYLPLATQALSGLLATMATPAPALGARAS